MATMTSSAPAANWRGPEAAGRGDDRAGRDRQGLQAEEETDPRGRGEAPRLDPNCLELRKSS